MSRPQSLMAWNTFKLCTGLRVIGSLMIVVVLAIIGVSYYAIVIVNYGPELLKGGSSLALSFFVLIAFHGLLAMVLWSYFAVSFTDPGSVPKSWSPVTDDEDTEAQIMPLATTTISSSIGAAMNMEGGSMVNATDHNSQVRWCRKCNHYKPLRCHHCSVCGSCVLKMDHHCVWIANCVGARNYKFFLLFLIYTFLETTLDTIALLPHFILFFKDIDQISGSAAGLASTFIAFILNLAFALSLLGFLIMHASLVASNTTTIEAYEKKRSSRWRYDLGRNQNFEQVFGTRKWYWLVPIYSSEDLRSMPVLQGLDYPVRSDIEGLD